MPIFVENADRFAEQDVLSRLNYGEDWSAFIELSEGDEIATSSWMTSEAGLTFQDGSFEAGSTSVWIKDGVPGKVYRVANVIETAQGRRDVRYFFLSVAEGADAAPTLSTALFNRFKSVAALKAASLAFTSGSLPLDGLSDDAIWQSLVQAEATVSHELRVLLAPTVILPEEAPQS